MTVRDRQHRVLARVSRPRNRLYIARLRLANPICLAAHPDEEAWRWHARFGHQHFDGLERLIRHNMVHGMPLIHHTEQVCDACLVGKQRRAPFPQQANYRAAEPLELVHGDLCCPISPPTQGGKRYFLLLVDDHSRFMWLYLLRSKDEAAEAIQRFKVHAERETGRKLRTFRSDRRGEFNSGEFSLYLADLDVQWHLTAPYTPQQNGVVQRRNQTVVGTARCMLKGMGVPPQFWGEAVTTTVFVLNRAYSRSVAGKTPFEAWHGRKPSVDFLRVFGCVAHVKDTRPHLSKLEDRSKAMVLLGYEPGSKAYRLFNPVGKRVRVSHDVVFDETRAWEWEKDTGVEDTSFVIEATSTLAAAPSSTARSPTPPEVTQSPTATTPSTETDTASTGS